MEINKQKLLELDRLYNRIQVTVSNCDEGRIDAREVTYALEDAFKVLGWALGFNNRTLEDIQEKTLLNGPAYRGVWYVLDSFVNYRQTIPWTDEQVREHIDSLCDQLMENSFNA